MVAEIRHLFAEYCSVAEPGLCLWTSPFGAYGAAWSPLISVTFKPRHVLVACFDVIGFYMLFATIENYCVGCWLLQMKGAYEWKKDCSHDDFYCKVCSDIIFLFWASQFFPFLNFHLFLKWKFAQYADQSSKRYAIVSYFHILGVFLMVLVRI